MTEAEIKEAASVEEEQEWLWTHRIGTGGMGRLATVFMLTIFGGFLWLGYKVVPYYYNYFEILGLMEFQAARAKELNDGEIRKNLLLRIRQLGIPIVREENLRIRRDPRRMKIDLAYQNVLEIDFGPGYRWTLWIFDFHPAADKEYTK